MQLGLQQSHDISRTRVYSRLQWTRFAETGDDVLPEVDAVLTTLGVEHYFGNDVTAFLSLPLGAVTRSPGPGAPDDESTIRTTGFGDLVLGLRYELGSLWGRSPSLVFDVGVGLPTGSSAKLGAGSVDTPAVVALGTGAYSLRAGATATTFVSGQLGFYAGLDGWSPLAAGPNGLRFGARFGYRAGALWVLLDGLSVGAGVTGSLSDHAESEVEGELVNSGGHWLVTDMTVGVRVSEALYLSLGARVPVVRNPNGSQSEESFALNAGIALTFAGDDEGEDDPDQEHERSPGAPPQRDQTTGHGPQKGEADGDHSADAVKPPHQPDVRHLAVGGASFALDQALAAGKVTVIDFWAEWCKPCALISDQLTEAARQDPRLAVRKVEAPDSDSPVVAEHLAGTLKLPTVWIFSAEGQLVASLTGTTPELVAEAIAGALR